MLLIMPDEELSPTNNNGRRVVNTMMKRSEEWRNSPRIEDPLGSGDDDDQEDMLSDYCSVDSFNPSTSMDLFRGQQQQQGNNNSNNNNTAPTTTKSILSHPRVILSNSNANNSREWMSQEFTNLPDDTIQPSIFDEATVDDNGRVEHDDHHDQEVEIPVIAAEQIVPSSSSSMMTMMMTTNTSNHHPHHHHSHPHPHPHHHHPLSPHHPFSMAYIETAPPPGEVDLFEPTRIACVPPSAKSTTPLSPPVRSSSSSSSMAATMPRTPDLTSIGHHQYRHHRHPSSQHHHHQTRLATRSNSNRASGHHHHHHHHHHPHHLAPPAPPSLGGPSSSSPSVGASSMSPIRTPSEPENVSAQLDMLEKIKTLTKQHQQKGGRRGGQSSSSSSSSTSSQQQQQQQQNQQQPHHNKKAADPPQCWIRETEITEKDVICERGGKSNRHAGTKRYRGMIERYKKEYQQLTAKADKTNLSRSLIAQIQKNGGRFLKKDEDTNQYFVLSAVETTKKVSQALREKKVLKWTET